MLKKGLSIAITLLLLLGSSFALSHYYHLNFFDYSLFVGVMVTVSIFFFTSIGEVKGRFLDRGFQRLYGIRPAVEDQKLSFTPSIPFITSLIYTIISFAAIFLD